MRETGGKSTSTTSRLIQELAAHYDMVKTVAEATVNFDPKLAAHQHLIDLRHARSQPTTSIRVSTDEAVVAKAYLSKPF